MFRHDDDDVRICFVDFLLRKGSQFWKEVVVAAVYL